MDQFRDRLAALLAGVCFLIGGGFQGEAATPRAGFSSLLPERTGVAFTNHLSADRALANHILLNGSGVAIGDVDGDGLNDVFLAGLEGGSALYRNRGDWRFTNVTEQAFGPKTFAGMDANGVVLTDLDGDGLPDLLINGVGTGTRIFMNRGSLRFEETTAGSGLAGRGGPSSFALADVDQDGDLDLYIVRYRSSTVRDEFQQRFGIRVIEGRPVLESVNGRPVTDPDLVGRFSVDQQGRVVEHGEADGLYRNDGKGKFTLIPFTGGAFRDESGKALTSPPYDWGLAAMFHDLNGDRIPDLYVCNDLSSPDRIWIGDGKGGFQAIARTAVRKTSWFSMGIDFGDLDRDGQDDFMVTDMLSRDPVRRQADAQNLSAESEPFVGIEERPQVPRNTLYRGRGDGTFSEVAWSAGIAATDWSWSPVFLDVDLDGYEDILITTGFERDVQDSDVAEEIERIRQAKKLSDAEALQLRRRFPSHALPNLAYRNLGGMQFEEWGANWGFNHHGISQGIALGDLDNDGDQDVVLNQQNAAALFLRNDAEAPRIRVQLQGRAPNTAAVGARIEVQGGPVSQSQGVVAGGRFLSGDAPARTFAARSASEPLSVTVTWPDGRQSVRSAVKPGSLLLLQESGGKVPGPEPGAPVPALFTDVSERLSHRHRDEPFDDSQLQPLLPRALSNLGPAVAWGDLDLDGDDDLVVGAGRGGSLGVFFNQGQGGFSPATSAPFSAVSPVDQAGILIRPVPGRKPRILIAFSNYESPGTPGAVRTLDLAEDAFRRGGIRLQMVVGPMALADIDGDGQLDLFLGGRVAGGRYGEPVMSALLRGKEGGWVPDPENTRLFQQLGMVTSAAFTDLDDDGDPELVVATEWGAVRIFDNARGRFSERTSVELRWTEGDARPRPVQLAALTGWWNSVTPVDFDDDGRMDLILGNWGRNTRYQVGPGRTADLFRGNFAGDGIPLLLESYPYGTPARDLPWITRDALASVWPSLLERFPTRAAFGAASVQELLGDRWGEAQRMRVTTLDSVALWNRGDHWVVQSLPALAQAAPVFGIATADFNGDGAEDLFLAQNFFGTGPGADRHDAGAGLVLLGNGRGAWEPLSTSRSGISLSGEQRGAAVSDFDGDGRPDLVVTQNSESTRLFRNTGGKPGIRVRLRGEAGNPTGIGVRVRAIASDGRAGPVREIRAGAGYWSQDSSTLVFAGPTPVAALEVRWPGQLPRRVPVPAGSSSMELSPIP